MQSELKFVTIHLLFATGYRQLATLEVNEVGVTDSRETSSFPYQYLFHAPSISNDVIKNWLICSYI